MLNKDNKVHYIFWTGGFDSTFSIIYYVLFSNIPIQPIYITDPCVDGVTDIMRTCYGRQNIDFEINSMKKIRNNIQNKFPDKSNKLLPTIYINKVELTSEIIKLSEQNYKLGLGTRYSNQYSRIAQICENNNINAIVSVIKELDDPWNKIIHPNIINIDTGEAVLNPYVINELKLYKRMIFPLINKSKKDLYQISKCLNFNDILEQSYSCLYPNSDGKPCGECNMCKERIKNTILIFF